MNTNNNLKYWLLFTLLLPNVTLVSAKENLNLFSLSLEELSQLKVTIASRSEETIINAPSSVSVFTRGEIERLGVQTLSELMNYVPGFQSYMSPHDSNRSLYMVRGLADIYGRNLLLMIDGHRINDEYTGGFTYADHLLGLSNVKQVEFIRGPGSTLYGSNAFSGVINIITDKQLKYASVTVGSNDSRGVAGATHGKFGKLQSSFSFNYYRDNGQSYSSLTDKTGFNKSTLDPVEVFDGSINLAYQRTRLILEYMNTKLNDYYVARRINNGINKNDTQRIGAYLEYDFKMPDHWEGSGRIGTMRHDRNQEFLLAPSSTSKFFSNWQQDTSEVQVDFNYLLQGTHQLSFGSYVGIMDIPVASNKNQNRFVLDKSRTTVGLYLQDQFDIITDVIMTAGLRYDDYSDFGDSLNPRLTVRYQWRDFESFKFMYGRAYRAPSLGDIYDKENFFSSKAPELDPVTVDSYEIAYLYSKNNNNLTVTAFYNDYKNFISTRLNPDSTLTYDNMYDNDITGLEFELSWNLTFNWSTHVGITQIISNTTHAPAGTRFTPQDQLTPTTYGNVQLNYHRQKWNWNISTVAHNGISVLQDQGSLFLVNTKLLYQLSSHWELSANIQNLFDETYSTPQSFTLGTDQSGTKIQELPSRRREFFITAQYNFGK
ncbi:MAG: TonB-dependent receptor plug domain-containing protein [Thiohalomonadales bacterium]